MANVTCSNCGTEFDSNAPKCPSCGTKNRLKVCHVCGAQMAKNAKRCPNCGAKNKKPIYTRWWFWGLMVCFIFWLMKTGKDAESSTTSITNEDPSSNVQLEQTQEEQDKIIGVWYPYQFMDRSEENVRDLSQADSQVIVQSDYSLEIFLEGKSYPFTWSFLKEDEDGRYYTLVAADGTQISAALLSEDCTLFGGVEEYNNNLVILLGEDGLFCTREDKTNCQEQDSQTSDLQKTSSVSLGNQNAVKRAKEYLEYSSFSYTGLIDQLEFEGFSTSEATYAADNCNADWNEQAALKAQQYLEYSAFSRSELIDQLEFEGFTHTQAVYGAKENGY